MSMPVFVKHLLEDIRAVQPPIERRVKLLSDPEIRHLRNALRRILQVLEEEMLCRKRENAIQAKGGKWIDD